MFFFKSFMNSCSKSKNLVNISSISCLIVIISYFCLLQTKPNKNDKIALKNEFAFQTQNKNMRYHKTKKRNK